MKTCSICGISKNISEYHKKSNSKDGLRSWCRECASARDKEYRRKNREKINKQRRESRQNNPQKYKDEMRRWVEANPNRKNEFEAKRRASKRDNGIYKILKRDLERLYASPCIYCGSVERITADHVIPLSRGGTHGIGNLVPACIKCNINKGTRTVMEWRTCSASPYRA